MNVDVGYYTKDSIQTCVVPNFYKVLAQNDCDQEHDDSGPLNQMKANDKL